MNKKRFTCFIVCLLGIFVSLQLKAEQIIVRFDANGGTGGPMINQIFEAGVAQKLTANTYILAGHTFDGWAESLGGERKYADAQDVNFKTEGTDSREVVLYACWKANSYTIVFDADAEDVEGNMEEQIFVYGEEGTLRMSTFNRTGYVLAGWATVSGGEKIYETNEKLSSIDFGEATTITLYAVWKLITYKVIFEKNAPKNAIVLGRMEDQFFSYNERKKLNVNKYTTKLKYKFSSWNTQADGNGVSYEDGEEVMNLTTEDGNTITLYAQWVKGEYVVKFDPNLGQGYMASKTYEMGNESNMLPKVEFSRRGYTFEKWTLDRKGESQSFVDEAILEYDLTEIHKDTVILFAQWAPNQYKVQFEHNVPVEDADKVTGEMELFGMTYDVSDTLPQSKFKYEGHSFDFWSETQIPDGTTGGYDSREPVMNLTAVPNGIVHLYAQWKLNTYIVIFNVNTDDDELEGNMSSQLFHYGEQSNLKKNEFRRPGYKFMYWSTNPTTIDTIYQDEQKVENLTLQSEGEFQLYAHWQPINYKVVFDSNEGTGNMQGMIYEYDEFKPLTENKFTRLGYTFAGWNTNANGTGEFYSGIEEVGNMTLTDNAIVTLYAQWRPNNYVIAFHGNHPEVMGSMDCQNMVYDQKLTLSENCFAVQDSIFIGWSRKPEGIVEFGDQEEVMNLSEVADDTIKLYAQWGGLIYTVRFLPNGGTGDSYNQTLRQGVEDVLLPNRFNRIGYTFLGWTRDPESDRIDYRNGESVHNLVEEGKVLLLYAVWQVNSYTVRFHGGNADGGRMDNMVFTYAEEKNLLKNQYTYTGHTFLYWTEDLYGEGPRYTDEALVSGLAEQNGKQIILYAQWKANEYVVSFDSNGIEATGEMADMNFVYEIPQNLKANGFQRTGYSFVNWNTSADGKGMSYEAGELVRNLTIQPDDTIILYAQWRAHEYTLRFNKNAEKAVGNMADLHLLYTDTIHLSGNTFLYTGYSFIGWSEASQGAKTFDNEEEIYGLTDKDGEIIDLYALWNPNKYFIRFDTNGGYGEMEKMELIYDGDVQMLPSCSFTRMGYTFLGWNTDPKGKGNTYMNEEKVQNETATNNAEIVLYAQWRVNSYCVHYDANGGEGNMDDLIVNYDETAMLSTNAFTRMGYTYIGWNTKPDGTGIFYENGADVFNWSEKDGETIVLYAQWDAHNYTVLYVPNGGNGDMNNQPFVYGEEQRLYANLFTRNGYTFSGWNTKSKGDGIAYADLAVVKNLSAKDDDFVGLYAQWQPLQYDIIFKNEDGTELQSSKWNYDSTPEYTGDVPKKASTEKYSYVFTGWYPAIVPVTADAVYMAQFRAVLCTYTVTFVSEGEILQIDELEYGEIPYYRGEEPVKLSTDGLEYRFVGWSPQITEVTGNAEYTAVFEEMDYSNLSYVKNKGMLVRVEARHIYIEGIGDKEEIAVYDVNARCIYRGIGRDIEVPFSGMYVVCRIGEIIKVMVE